MGSQWSLFKVNELETVKPVPVTTRARGFCVRWRREMTQMLLRLRDHSKDVTKATIRIDRSDHPATMGMSQTPGYDS